VETRTINGLTGATQNTTKTTTFFEEFPSDIRFNVLKFADNRLKQGCTEKGVKSYLFCLRNLIRNRADLNNPESIKTTIANMNVSPRTKNYHIGVYDSFLKHNNKTWQRPKYTVSQKLPYVPLESEIDQIIGGCSKTIATVIQTIKETGARIGEVTRIQWEDVDINRKIITINYPEKGSMPRQIKVTEKLITMLNSIPRKRKTIFAKKPQISHQYYQQRKHIAYKLENPRLRQIGFHSIRHWHATIEFHKTKNLYMSNKD
jgi:integrase